MFKGWLRSRSHARALTPCVTQEAGQRQGAQPLCEPWSHRPKVGLRETVPAFRSSCLRGRRERSAGEYSIEQRVHWDT